MTTLKENIQSIMTLKSIEEASIYGLLNRVYPEAYETVIDTIRGVDTDPPISAVKIIASILQCSLDELFNYNPTACALNLRFIIPVSSFELSALEQLNKRVTEVIEENFDVVGTVETYLQPTDLEVFEEAVV